MSAGARAVASAEERVGGESFTSLKLDDARATKVASAPDALARAVKAAAEGKRASAIVASTELYAIASLLDAAVRARLPLVVHALRGAAGCGRDEVAAVLDLGAGVVTSFGVEDALDVALAVHRAAEDCATPFVHLEDAPPLAAMHVEPPPAADVAAFLARGLGLRAKPSSVDDRRGQKRLERGFASRAPFALASALREVSAMTGRAVHAIERFDTADADEILVASSSAFVPARALAKRLRGEGRKVGALGVRALRPFFPADVVKALARARAVVVLEPLDVALAPAGPLATMVKASFADALTWANGFPGVGRVPPIVSAVFATTEGELSEADARSALDELAAGDQARRLVVFGSDGA